MSETSWHGSSNAGRLLNLALGKVSSRKLRLLAVAWLRHSDHFDAWPPPECSHAVALAETWADGVVPADELSRAYTAAEQAAGRLFEGLGGFGSAAAEGHSVPLARACVCALHRFPTVAARGVLSFLLTAESSIEQRSRCDPKWPHHNDLRLTLLRDVFGDPFHYMSIDPSWLTSTAVGLAAAIYERHAFGDLPILADALEDAGCDHPAILAHCRGDGPHARGCWVLDLLLGRA